MNGFDFGGDSDLNPNVMTGYPFYVSGLARNIFNAEIYNQEGDLFRFAMSD